MYTETPDRQVSRAVPERGTWQAVDGTRVLGEERPSLVFMFSGQGSQYHQMARELYEIDPLFRSELLELDRCYEELVGESVLDRVYGVERAGDGPFKRMLYTHASIYMIEYCLVRLLNREGVFADYYLGASLGELTAMTLAAGIPASSVIRELVEHARICESELDEGGGMLAVFGSPDLGTELLERFPELDLAAVNFEGHFVVSGPSVVMEVVRRQLAERRTLSQRIEVPFAFHSRQFDSLRGRFTSRLLDNAPRFCVPCVSCAERRMLRSTSEDLIWSIVRKPILFAETFASLAMRGSFVFIDAGPSGTLATFARKILRADRFPSTEHSVLTPYGSDRDNLTRLLGFLNSNRLLR